MGRLFWKLFLFILLGQLAGVIGTGALFWLERQQFAERPGFAGGPAHRHASPPGEHEHSPSPGFERGPPPDRPPPPGKHGPLPLVPLLVGLVASVFCAAGMAWYFARPIRHLRRGFECVAEGDLEVRVSPGMGGRRDELADLGRDFDRMTARLQVVIDGQKHLLHDVSHEMRSPLARMQAAIGLARQQPARLDDSLQRIEREGERMNQLVGELLTLSRLESGMAGLPESVDLGELLDEMVEDARFEGATRGIHVDYRLSTVAEVLADPELLYRAIENVVRNALRHSPAGGTIRIDAGVQADGCFHIEIADQGPGVPSGELEAIFRPFFRGAGQPSGLSYGLGLAIAQRVIAAVNGQISAKNAAAGGLSVDIALPVLPPRA